MKRLEIDTSITLREWFEVLHLKGSKVVWLGPIRVFYGRNK